jgi:hypothetical protein
MRARGWWRPELWLVLGIPVLTVAGGVWTLVLASGSDLSDDGEHAAVRRTAQVQIADLAPDFAAARQGLTAQLSIDRTRGEVQVRLPQPVAGGDELELRFVHALQSGRDLQLRLRPRGDAWVAIAAPDAGARWRVVLADVDRQWRVVGTLPSGGTRLSLQPALPPP